MQIALQKVASINILVVNEHEGMFFQQKKCSAHTLFRGILKDP